VFGVVVMIAKLRTHSSVGERQFSHRPANARIARVETHDGATFQLGAMFGVGRCGEIEKTSLISLPGYPTTEYGGLVFVYGPARHRVALFDVRHHR
jgi:hypothetical protein